MQTRLIRTFIAALLAVAMPVFAVTNGPKHKDPAPSSSKANQESSTKDAKKSKQEKPKQLQRENRKDSDKEFDRVLQGIYG